MRYSKFWTLLMLSILFAPKIVFADPAPISQKEYVRRAHTQINALSHQLYEAESRVQRLDASTRAECNEALKNIRRKERLARARLDTIRRASAGDWRKLRKDED